MAGPAAELCLDNSSIQAGDEPLVFKTKMEPPDGLVYTASRALLPNEEIK